MNVSVIMDHEDVDLNFLELQCSISTDGSGRYSATKKSIRIHRILHSFHKLEDEFYGEARVYFDNRDWNTNINGLIYTDEQFLKHLRLSYSDLGMQDRDTLGINYSEQGMQSTDYVSLDINTSFVCGLIETLTQNNQLDVYIGLEILMMGNTCHD